MTDKQQFANFINGESVPPAEGGYTDIIDPKTAEAYATAPRSTQADVDAAFEAAAEASKEWKRTTPSDRMNALLKMADAIEANAEDLVATETRNTGKPVGLTRAEEIGPMVDQIRFFAGAARNLEGKGSAEYMTDHTSWVRREPIGVVGAVTPWNYPMMMAVWKFGPALAAGNTMVLKPSDTTPASTVRMAQLFAEVLPPGVFNVVCGDRDTGSLIAAHPTPGLVSITGSTRAGRAVARAASDTLKRTHLELGGKAPVVVFADADMGKAAEDIAAAGYFNAGQDCTAATRVIVQKGAEADFAAALAEQAGDIRFSDAEFADGADPDGFYIPPVNNINQLGHVSGLVDRLPDHANVVAGGSKTGTGYFYSPTVVSGLQEGDEAVHTEIFGPVITVQSFTDEDDALRLANNTVYGLASSVWTSDHGVAMRMANGIDTGCVWINCHIPLVAEMPHGGVKESGYGKDLSQYSLDEYTRVKHVMSYIGR